MKNVYFSLLLLSCFLISGTLSAQNKEVRQSPQAEVKTTLNYGQIVEVHYSSPTVRGRAIWGSLVPYGEVWRTGADEATTFETNKDVMISGKKLPAGKYALFTIPGKKEWTVIFNKDWKQWGATDYVSNKDVLRLTVPAYKTTYLTENLLIDVADNLLTIKWENVNVNLPIQ
ncbi:MAG: DUF2911 domain-containing protein [Bacteroidota bacterium]|nr:DUF2911 domain-containing protein [Bacteroidota bacterium]